MTNLKDYLSSLVTGINQARMLADFESARIAQIYAKDELLKTFSVPRFRLPDVELTIPIAVEELQLATEKDYQPIDNIRFASHTYQVMKDIMNVGSFERKQSLKIRSVISDEIVKLEKAIKSKGLIEEELQLFSTNVSKAFIEIIQNDLSKQKSTQEESLKQWEFNFTKEVANQLKSKLHPEIKIREKTESISETKIIAEAHRLKEISPNNIIQIKMKLTEEGMEWTKIDKEDGNHDMRLIPE